MMSTRFLPAVCALLTALAVAPAVAGSSSTIRIEPRPYYGAVVTVEQGVRVWRPLPPTRHMIINPTGAPVSVNVTDVRETVTHRGYGDVGAGSGPQAAGGYAPGYAAAGYGHGRFHRLRGHRDGRAPIAGLPVRPQRHGHGGKGKH